MTFPPEIYEKILARCDGRTLMTARRVCRQWKEIVEYLSKKTRIWEWRCVEEIPKRELTQYRNSYHNEDRNNWFYIYRNWARWENIPGILFETVLSPAEIPRITCIDVFGDYIAVGSDDGRVRIFDQYWKPLSTSRHQAEKVTNVSFLYGGPPNNILKLVIAYPRFLIVDDLFGDGYNYLIIEDVISHSVYNGYICYEKHVGRMTIEKLKGAVSAVTQNKPLDEISFTRIYSPNNITCINLWDGICTILTDNDVRKLDFYAQNIVPISQIPTKLRVNYSLVSNGGGIRSHNFHILRDDIIIVLCKDSFAGDEYMEVILMGRGTYVQKLINTSEVLGANITCICLYGHTLVLGVDTGIVYFYHVPSWKHFRIKDYQKKIIIGKHPITNVVVKETKDKRKFFVTSSFNIHEVVGFPSSFYV